MMAHSTDLAPVDLLVGLGVYAVLLAWLPLWVVLALTVYVLILRVTPGRPVWRLAARMLLPILVPVLSVGWIGTHRGVHAERARHMAAEAQLHSFATAIMLYKVNHGRLPDSLSDLVERDAKNNSQPYVREIPTNPWNNTYRYERLPGGYRLTCYGADAVPGGRGVNEDVVLE